MFKYANEDYTAEPFSSMLKASAESGYAPAMSLYALTHELDETYKNELLSKAAELGETSAIKEQIVYLANKGDLENNESLMQKAVFYADVLSAAGEAIDEPAAELVKACVLKLRKIASGKPPVSSKIGAVIVGVVVAVVALLLVGMIVVTGRLTLGTKQHAAPMQNNGVGQSVVFDTAA